MKNTLASFILPFIILLLVVQVEQDSVKPDRCTLVPDAGHCRAAFPKFYFEKNEKKCKQFIWGGCGGVVPFNTLEECEQQCECE